MERVARKLNVNTKGVNLQYNSQWMTCDQTLGHYDVWDNAVLHMRLKSNAEFPVAVKTLTDKNIRFNVTLFMTLCNLIIGKISVFVGNFPTNKF